MLIFELYSDLVNQKGSRYPIKTEKEGTYEFQGQSKTAHSRL